MLGGWGIVYIPGGDVYQMLQPPTPPQKRTLAGKIAKRSVKALVAAAQIYFWLKK